jgi:heptaprenyl diphosphate synthase
LNTRKVSYLGTLLALAVALGFLESLVPTPLPWVRLGLANLLTLIAILTCGWKEGFLVTILRVLITSLLLGRFISPAFLLSLGGGLTAAVVMALMAKGAWQIYSPLAISVGGAFGHGLAQVLVLFTVLIRTREVLFLLPWVLFPAIISGVVTGLLANLILLRKGSYFGTLGGRSWPCQRASSG